MTAVLLAAPLVALLSLSLTAESYENQTVLLMGIPDVPRVKLQNYYKLLNMQCSAQFHSYMMGCAVLPPRSLQVEVRAAELYPVIKIKPDLTQFTVRRQTKHCYGEVYVYVEVGCDMLESRKLYSEEHNEYIDKNSAIALEPAY